LAKNYINSASNIGVYWSDKQPICKFSTCTSKDGDANTSHDLCNILHWEWLYQRLHNNTVKKETHLQNSNM